MRVSGPAAKQAQRFARTPVETFERERDREFADERWADELPDDEQDADAEESADDDD